jgi:hypothetical protein
MVLACHRLKYRIHKVRIRNFVSIVSSNVYRASQARRLYKFLLSHLLPLQIAKLVTVYLFWIYPNRIVIFFKCCMRPLWAFSVFFSFTILHKGFRVFINTKVSQMNKSFSDIFCLNIILVCSKSRETFFKHVDF